MGDVMGAFNVAVGLADDPADAQNKAIKAQQSAEDRRATLAEEQFNYQKSLSDPFFKASLPAYYSLVDAITGQRQSYSDPSYTKLTADDIRAENLSDLKRRREEGEFNGYSDGKLGLHLDRNPNQAKYLTSQQYYRDPQGNITTQAPPMVQSEAFQPTETDAYKWQQSQMEKNTGRTLRSLGRSNSTFGMNVMADQNKNLAASEYDKQLGRLADLTNIARGGASTLAGASTGFSNQQQQGATNMGNNLANASLAGGMMKQNSLYNNQQSMNSLANLGLKIADGWGKSDNNYGSTWNDSGGDINNVDFGGDWGSWADGSKA